MDSKLPQQAPDLYIGLMSGTSLDGVDVILADFGQHPPKLLAQHHSGFSDHLKQQLLLVASNSSVDILALGELEILLSREYANAVNALLLDINIKVSDIAAIGCHGQTIRHSPHGPLPFTWQLGDPSVLAENTGITCVARFRQRDIAAGGQGAPLVPPFHQFLFASPEHHRVVLNLGGIANISWLPAIAENNAADRLLGFDTGPANILMDAWCQQHCGCSFDDNGDLARRGKLHEPLLMALQTHPYFALPYPKSTGREEFHLAWLQDLIDHLQITITAVDVLRTLVELTAWSVATAVQQLGPSDLLIACGGGAYNRFLLERLQALLGDTRVTTSTEFGIPPQAIEALAFAWLARQTLLGLPGNHPAVTGAKGFRILGGIFPA